MVEKVELSLEQATIEFPDFLVDAVIWEKLSEEAKEQLLSLGF